MSSKNHLDGIKDFVAMDLCIDGEYDPQFDITTTMSKWLIPAATTINLDALNDMVLFYSGVMPTVIKVEGGKYDRNNS